MDPSLSSEWIKISEPFPHVLHAELARNPVNAVGFEFWRAYGALFDSISESRPDIRAVVISSAFQDIFSAGFDLYNAGQIVKGRTEANPASDAARISMTFQKQIEMIQEAIMAPERCTFPVIAAIHGINIGLGVDIVSACDIRYAASDSRFTLKQVDIGMAADMGTLAYLPRVMGNLSFVREMAYTAEWFSASRAEQMGLVSKVVEGGREEVVASALELAKVIATKSPIAVTGTKRLLSHGRDHSVAESLQFTTWWNAIMLQTKASTILDFLKRPGSSFLPARPGDFKFGKPKL
ncbi:Delta2-dienoyl-CoA-isomerase [Lentinula edodes]|uniref:Delta2-dienoyl-CoA-isomerase n=1 Tax=Lentinula edodes TaxID=5353 RepID=UPI001BF292CB|nr:Delta2-dienoyl-CoA-isomerase [Lentinula edodes]KAF8823214.1 hypothetical protein HHX47_DHR10000076 [Lentinula edodes]KAH7879183.1 Delta2-dienoyl-CoA-isomerase [Lentinula edodes]